MASKDRVGSSPWWTKRQNTRPHETTNSEASRLKARVCRDRRRETVGPRVCARKVWAQYFSTGNAGKLGENPRLSTARRTHGGIIPARKHCEGLGTSWTKLRQRRDNIWRSADGIGRVARKARRPDGLYHRLRPSNSGLAPTTPPQWIQRGARYHGGP